MRKLRSQRGFTLIELIVAISIIGIIGIPLLGIFTSSINNNAHSKGRTSAVSTAQGFMDFYKAGSSREIMIGKNIGDIVCLYVLYRDGQSIPNDISGYSLSNHTNCVNWDTGKECFNTILDKYFPGSNYKYDFMVKSVLCMNDNKLIQISISVWDSVNKESSRVNLISLRSF